MMWEVLTGASSLPVKNFLISLADCTCAGVTAGSFIQGLPAKNEFHKLLVISKNEQTDRFVFTVSFLFQRKT